MERIITNRYQSDRKDLYAHLFIQWLASKDLLVQWMDNVENGHRTVEMRCGLVYNSPDNALTYSFGFSGSNEGRDFWVARRDEWSRVYRELTNLNLNLNNEDKT